MSNDKDPGAAYEVVAVNGLEVDAGVANEATAMSGDQKRKTKRQTTTGEEERRNHQQRSDKKSLTKKRREIAS